MLLSLYVWIISLSIVVHVHSNFHTWGSIYFFFLLCFIPLFLCFIPSIYFNKRLILCHLSSGPLLPLDAFRCACCSHGNCIKPVSHIKVSCLPYLLWIMFCEHWCLKSLQYNAFISIGFMHKVEINGSSGLSLLYGDPEHEHKLPGLCGKHITAEPSLPPGSSIFKFFWTVHTVFSHGCDHMCCH